MDLKIAASVTLIVGIAITSFVGNTLLIIACLNKSSGKVNVFLINLCLTDIFLTAYTPVLVYLLMYGAHHIFSPSSYLCYISNNLISLSTTANCLTILLIAIERYIAIHQPLQYHKLMSKERMAKTLVVCWSCVVLLVVAKDLIMGYFGGGPRYRSLKGYCVDDYYEDMIVKLVSELLCTGLFLTVPMAITTLLYFIILRKIYKSGQKFLSLRNSGKKTNAADESPQSGGDVLSELLTTRNTETLEHVLEMPELGEEKVDIAVMEELRDLSKSVNVEALSNTIRSSAQTIQGVAAKQHPRKMLRKQATAIELDMLNLNEEGIKEILASLETFRTRVAEENQLQAKASSLNENVFANKARPVKRHTSLCENSRKRRSLYSRKSAIDIKSNSVDSSYKGAQLNKLGNQKTLNNLKCCNDMKIGPIKDENEGNSKIDTAQENVDVITKDFNSDNTIGVNGQVNTEPSKERTAKIRQMSGSSQDALLDHTGQNQSEESVISQKSLAVPMVTAPRLPSRNRWHQAALAVAVQTQNTKSEQSLQSSDVASVTAKKPAAGDKWRSAALSLNPTIDLPSSSTSGSEEEKGADNWRMLILMMRLAKLAKQPSAVGNILQEKLGTTKYQIQIVKAALISCVAFYLFSLPFIITSALPSQEGPRPHNFPIIILPLVNCLADFIVYGFIHPTIRHELRSLINVRLRFRSLFYSNSSY